NLLRLLFASHQQNRKHYLQVIGKMSELILQAVAEVCVSTVEQGGVAGAGFSTDVTFSQWFCFLRNHNACSSLRSLLCLIERNTCRAKYREIWAILMHKIMFPSESCNSVSKGNSVRFPLSRKFSPRVPPEPLRVPQFGNRGTTVSATS